MLGAQDMSFTDAFFETMSGITTTGATVMEDLQLKDPGILLWRGLLQWFGGLGIVVVAIAILPELRVGGMQLFRSEAFDTFGKILPQAAQIAKQLFYIYLGLTIAALLVYAACGMKPIDALVHAMTSIATGGLANYDSSFGAFRNPAIHYFGALFMLCSALPYVRLVQLMNGSPQPLWRDPQVRLFLRLVAIFVIFIALGRWQNTGELEYSIRTSLFNVISIMTGTGYATEDYGLWGPFAMMAFFIIGMIGGCAGSTSCSVKVFRYQVLTAAVKAQIKLIQNPSSVPRARYDGRPISEDVLSSVMAFFLLFFLTLGVMVLVLSMIGLDLLTSLSGAAATLGNIGPGLGPEIGPSGNYAGLPDSAKWVLTLGMFLGRLELLSVFVLLMPRFWQR
jgi:trk system potassium uptake protein TrkH